MPAPDKNGIIIKDLDSKETQPPKVTFFLKEGAITELVGKATKVSVNVTKIELSFNVANAVIHDPENNNPGVTDDEWKNDMKTQTMLYWPYQDFAAKTLKLVVDADRLSLTCIDKNSTSTTGHKQKISFEFHTDEGKIGGAG